MAGAATQNPAHNQARRAHPLALVVAVAGLFITGGLCWVTTTLNANSNRRLLQLEVRQAASVIDVSLTAVQPVEGRGAASSPGHRHSG